MDKSEIIEGLKDLVKDRESFIKPDEPDSVFVHDKAVLQAAIDVVNRCDELENKPLTLKQLKKICKPNLAKIQCKEAYSPVWIVTLPDRKVSCQIARGRLIKIDNRCKPPKEYIDAHKVNLLLTDYSKTWLAYARKPGSTP